MLSEEIHSMEELIGFIERKSRLEKIIEEISTWKKIKMMQDTDDVLAAKRFHTWSRQIDVLIRPKMSGLDKKIYESDSFAALPSMRYGHYKELLKHSIELYRGENVLLDRRIRELNGGYDRLCSELAADRMGTEITISAAEKDSDEEYRGQYEKAWRMSARKMLGKREVFEEIFDQLAGLRHQLAANATFGNFRDFKYSGVGYTVGQISEFHDSIEAVIVPAIRKINEDKKKMLGVKDLRPWDMGVNPGEHTLRPFSSEEELLYGCFEIFRRIDPEFAGTIAAMYYGGLMDLSDRPGKAQGAFSFQLPTTGTAFVFMNATSSPEI
jgi:oligoendopeptidase F